MRPERTTTTRRIIASVLGSVLLRGLTAALPCVVPAIAGAQATVPTGFEDGLVAGGFTQPVGMAFLPDGRLLVIEQKSARVRLLVRGAIAAVDPVGTVPGVNVSGSERGLLGIAVDPGWPARPYLYVHSTYTGPPSRVRISRFTVTGDLEGLGDGALSFDPASRYDLLTDIPDAANNHNGGTVRFGPDGALYVSLGEDATPCAAQDTASLRGVILRLDVSRLPAGAGGPPARALITPANNPFAGAATANTRLIWAYGLRNPFRFQIDPATGTLLIADVGQDTWEEVDRATQGGMNFGWPVREGPASYSGACTATGAVTGPIFWFDHNSGVAVMSAGVYRRPVPSHDGFPPTYEGDAFVSDYFSGTMWRLRNAGGTWGVAAPVAGQPAPDHWAEGLESVPDYAIGPDGAWWYCKQSTGEIRRIAYTAPDVIPPARALLEP